MNKDLGTQFFDWAHQFTTGGFAGFPDVEKMLQSYMKRYPAEAYRKMSKREFRKFMTMLLKLDEDSEGRPDSRK